MASIGKHARILQVEPSQGGGVADVRCFPVDYPDLPTTEEIREELQRTKRLTLLGRIIRNTLFTLITVAAMAVLVATLWLPVLQIYGTSMSPTLEDGNVVVSVKSHDMEQGDVLAFYYNNKILVKRLIATSGQWVNIDETGNVYVDGELVEEPYLVEKALGECDITFPYQVPDGRVFVLGDHRSVSVDSRSSAVGCVAEEQVVGKLVCRIWPLDQLDAI